MNKLHDLNDMAAFAKVVQAGGFTAAAHGLGLPKSNISRRISRLEGELGVRLLERTTRSLQLTHVGEIYYQHCQRILEEADYAEQSLHQLSDQPRGLLRISATVCAGQQLLAPLMAEFLHRYRDIQLQLTLANRQVNLLEEDFDANIRNSPIDDDQISCTLLGSSSMQLYAGPGYLAQRGRPQHPEQLAQHDILVLTKATNGHAYTIELSDSRQSATFTLRPRAFINDYKTLYQLVCDDCGIALLPHTPDPANAGKTSLIQVLEEWRAPAQTFYACYAGARSGNPRLRALIEFLRDKITPPSSA